MRTLFYLAAVIWLSACQPNRSVQLVYPDKNPPYTEWTPSEKQKDIAIRSLYRDGHVSTHLIRLQGKEFPHYHDRHDLTVTLLSGTGTMHFQERSLGLKPGDVVFIPQGTWHWAENTNPEAGVVFAVFSPPFDGKDRRKAE